MNKLINLLIIFLTLAYLIPNVFKYVPGVATNIHYFNLLAGFSVMVIQFLYNFSMNQTKRKISTVKNNLIDAALKGVVVVASYYLYEEARKNWDVNIKIDEEVLKASSVIVILLLFILINSLVMP